LRILDRYWGKFFLQKQEEVVYHSFKEQCLLIGKYKVEIQGYLHKESSNAMLVQISCLFHSKDFRCRCKLFFTKTCPELDIDPSMAWLFTEYSDLNLSDRFDEDNQLKSTKTRRRLEFKPQYRVCTHSCLSAIACLDMAFHIRCKNYLRIFNDAYLPFIFIIKETRQNRPLMMYMRPVSPCDSL
jgi:hypothetical protein